MKIDFELLKSIFGTTLPSKEKFLSNGEHAVTMKHIAIHCGKRKGYEAWDQFVEEYAVMFKAPVKPVTPVVEDTDGDEADD
ncbi:hypothetical protein VPHD239_0004 [Vibrio phage D239]